MPFRRRIVRRRRPRRKFNRKRGFKRNALRSIIMRGPTGVVVPDRYFTKMTFLDINTQKLGTLGTISGQVQYAANALSQPASSAGTPMGWAAMSGLYRFYRVHGVKFTVVFVNSEAFPVMASIIPLNETVSNTIANQQKTLQNAYSKQKVIGQTGGMDRVTISAYASTDKVAGIRTKFQETYASVTSGVPVDLWYWYAWASPLETALNSFTTAGVGIQAKLTFYVEWFERNIMTT